MSLSVKHFFVSGFKYNQQIGCQNKFPSVVTAVERKSLAPSKRIWESSTFITSCLDDCNSLYFDAHLSLPCCLQLFHYVAARPPTGKRHCDHITPVMVSLHWLSVSGYSLQFYYLSFKSCMGWNHSISIGTPICSSQSDVVNTPDALRYSKAQSENWGGTAFAVAAPNLRNSQILETVNISTAQCLEDFKSFLNLLALTFLKNWNLHLLLYPYLLCSFVFWFF